MIQVSTSQPPKKSVLKHSNGKDTGRSNAAGQTVSDHDDGEEWAGFDDNELVTAFHATKSTNGAKHDVSGGPPLKVAKKDKKKKTKAAEESSKDHILGQKATCDDTNFFDTLNKEVDDEVDGKFMLLPELDLVLADWHSICMAVHFAII